MWHWKLAKWSGGPVCGTPGAVKMAAAVTTVTCPACRAALFPAVTDRGEAPLDTLLPERAFGPPGQRAS